MGNHVRTAGGLFATAVALGLGAGAVAADTADPALWGALNNSSLLGIGISGEGFCSYYAPDGTLTSVIGGVVQSGSWTLDGIRLCETVGGVAGCDKLALVPPTMQVVRMTADQGTGGFDVLAALRPGDQCLIDGTPTIPDEASFPGLLAREAAFVTADGVVGGYISQGGGTWAEVDATGVVAFEFVEVGRDDGTVYLEDSSRDVAIQLDLYLRQVMYGSPIGGELSPLYAISEFH
jgi:hypothetical protein